EQETAGLQINMIPRDGGNFFGGTFQLNGSSGALQGNNLTPRLKALGVPVQGKLQKLYDIGGGFGGPIAKDRVWFFAADRWWNSASIVAGSFYNATPKPVYGLFPVYTPDVNRPSINSAPNHNDDLRLTWQVNNSHKLGYFMELESACNCFFGASGTMAAESSQNLTAPYGTKNLFQATWTYVKGNRWLFTAGDSTFLSGSKPGGELNAASLQDVALRDLNTGFYYNNHQDDPNPSGGVCCTPIADGKILGSSWYHDQRYSATYTTGSHTLKVGAQTYFYGNKSGTSAYNETPLGPVLVNVRGGVCLTPGCTAPPLVPASILLLINPQGPASADDQGGSRNLTTALFAQEQWTMRRMTLNLGVRYDGMRGKYLAYKSVANNYAPSFAFPEVPDSPKWNDIAPRVGVAYDLFGNGKTAVKGSFGRFVSHQTGAGSSPASLLGFSGGTRTWNDTNQDFFPNCVLTNPLANGECGPLPNANRGLPTAQSTFYDSEYLAGWGSRPYLWKSSVSLQQQLRPGFGINVGYFHTVNANITVTDNRAVTPSDYDQYCVTAPTDARLGDVSGKQLCGLSDLNPSKFGRTNNLITIPSTLNVNPKNQFDGVDIALDARFGKGGVLSGGVSTSKTVVDNCYTIDAPFRNDYCRTVTNWSNATQIKLLGNYPLPWWGLNVSGTYMNLPGPSLSANRVYSSAEIAPSLGRPLSAGATGTVTIPLLVPNTVWAPRFNQMDVRLTKSLRVQKLRVQGQFDVYNLFNSSAVLAQNATFGSAWLRPTTILGARLIKFGMQLDWQ
ncbi:MAG: hypothetical protein ABL986_23020, partial [Vicinamibacterales bacterium]